MECCENFAIYGKGFTTYNFHTYKIIKKNISKKVYFWNYCRKGRNLRSIILFQGIMETKNHIEMFYNKYKFKEKGKYKANNQTNINVISHKHAFYLHISIFFLRTINYYSSSFKSLDLVQILKQDYKIAISTKSGSRRGFSSEFFKWDLLQMSVIFF